MYIRARARAHCLHGSCCPLGVGVRVHADAAGEIARGFVRTRGLGMTESVCMCVMDKYWERMCVW